MKKYALPFAVLMLAACNSGEEITTTEIDEPVAKILEYVPAPGQFINEPLSGFDGVVDAASACDYAARRFAEENWVSLGGWGGYVVAAFGTPVPNTGKYDLYVKGNPMPTSSEPGVVWVSQDANGDGVPNDTWYELKGSKFGAEGTIRGYKITYTRPAGDKQPVAWEDSEGMTGSIDRMDQHAQASYYPAWIATDKLVFTGTRLPANIDQEENLWVARFFEWGYADNYSTIDRIGTTNRFRIGDAVTADGMPANLTQVDFIKVQTGVNAKAPLIGEVSTEVCGIGCYRTVTKSN